MPSDRIDKPRPDIELSVGLLLGLVLVVCAWPGFESAIRFPDSAEYLRWPAPVKLDGLTRLGPRMPGYPIVLMAVGSGGLLVQLQVWLSLACFGWLGWTLARVPGFLLLGLLSLAPQMRLWSLSVLSESLSLSMLALLVGLGIHVIRRPGAFQLPLWGAGILVFAMLRPGNAVFIPFLLVPFVGLAHDFAALRPWAVGLRSTWPRFALAAGLALCVFVLGFGLAERSGFWRMNYTTALMERVVTDADARAYFAARGMPTPVVWNGKAFGLWFETRGRATYQGWVLSRPEAYVEAWHWLRPPDQADTIWQRYIEPKGPAPVQTPLSATAERLFELSAPPPVLWLLVCGAACAMAWRASPRGRVLGLSLAALALGAYVQVFVAYHASAAEEIRHTLGGSLLFRMSFAIGLFVLLYRFVPGGGRRPSALADLLRASEPES
jgi:hypothetical protein